MLEPLKIIPREGKPLMKEEETVYSPAAIVAIFNAGITIKEEKRIIRLRGVFKKTGTANYGGFYYNRLKDEAAENQITLITPAIIHNKLDDNKTIDFNGYITRRIDKNGRIDIILNIIDLVSLSTNKYSEVDEKKMELINKKVAQTPKDLDAVIKNAVFNNRVIKIVVIMGRSGIIDNDIKKAMGDVSTLFDLKFHRVSLSASSEIINAIKTFDKEDTDIICVARGGGENLETFDDTDICNAILDCKTIIASAIGHADDVTMFEKLSDKKFITPTHFGTYLKETYTQTIEEFQQSKAKIIQDVEVQLKTVYEKKVENLNQQIKAQEELSKKRLEDSNKVYAEQIDVLQNKIKAFEELAKKSSTETQLLHQTEVSNFKKQIDQLSLQHREQVEQIQNLQNEKVQALTEQILSLQKQHQQKDELLQQSRDIAKQYKSQNSSTTIIIVAIVATIIGLLIGLALK